MDGNKIRTIDPLNPGAEQFLFGTCVRGAAYNPGTDHRWDDSWTWREFDSDIIRGYGFNFIRLICYWEAFEKSQSPSEFVYDMDYVQKIKETVQTYNAKGIYVLIDLHTHSASYASNLSKFIPVAGQSFAGAWFTDTSPTSAREHIRRLWLMLSEQFKDNWGVAGYDICNEPHLGDTTITYQQAADCWFDIADYVISALRANGEDHIAFINFSPWASNGTFMRRPLNDLNVCYEPHWYVGVDLSRPNWPVTNNNLEWLREQWRTRFKDKLESFGVPFMVGEFGFECSPYALDRETWLRNNLIVFWETLGLHGFTYWSYIAYGGVPCQTWWPPILMGYTIPPPPPPPPAKATLRVLAVFNSQSVEASGTAIRIPDETVFPFTTPVDLELEPGTYNVECVYQGITKGPEQVTLLEGDTKVSTFDFTPTPVPNLLPALLVFAPLTIITAGFIGLRVSEGK